MMMMNPKMSLVLQKGEFGGFSKVPCRSRKARSQGAEGSANPSRILKVDGAQSRKPQNLRMDLAAV